MLKPFIMTWHALTVIVLPLALLPKQVKLPRIKAFHLLTSDIDEFKAYPNQATP